MQAKKAFSFWIIPSDFGLSNPLVPNERRLSEIRTSPDFGPSLFCSKIGLVGFSDTLKGSHFETSGFQTCVCVCVCVKSGFPTVT